jgi:hypothetical protein
MERFWNGVNNENSLNYNCGGGQKLFVFLENQNRFRLGFLISSPLIDSLGISII